MKKSMIAAAVVATAFAASANAGYFVIANSAYTPTGGTPQSLSVPDLDAGTMAAGGGLTYTGSAGGTVSLSNTDANTIATAVGNGNIANLTNGTIYYFGFEASASGPGYFGFLFMGNGADIDFTVANAHRATLGVHSNMGTSGFLGNTYGGDQNTTTAGQAYVAIFAGLGVNQVLGGSTVSDTNFNVSYLSFDGSNWNSVASATNVESSTLNTAMYAVPVPAPALLAGAGLIGAAAVRRRMAKKA